MYTIRACEGFPKITWERTVTKATKKWSFHASEMLIAKIINIWQVGISVASFILKDLSMLCRLGKAQRPCLCLMKCSFLRMEQVFDSRKVHTCFEESVAFCFWPHSRCWRLVEPNSAVFSLPSPGTPLCCLCQQIRHSLCSLLPITTLWGQEEIRLLTCFHPGDPKSPSSHPFFCIFKLSHSPSCLTWYRLYTEPGEHFSFPLLYVFLACFYFYVLYFMFTYAGKCLGGFTEEVLQKAICFVFVFPVWKPASASPKGCVRHQGESVWIPLV